MESRSTSPVGYSMQDIDNSDGRPRRRSRAGHYALGNVCSTPVPNVMLGGEIQGATRELLRRLHVSDGYKLQFSFKYNFSWKLGG